MCGLLFWVFFAFMILLGVLVSDANARGQDGGSEMSKMNFKYTSDFDQNDILYYLGTRGKSSGWQNPAEMHYIDVYASSVMTDSLPLTAAVGRKVCFSKIHISLHP